MQTTSRYTDSYIVSGVPLGKVLTPKEYRGLFNANKNQKTIETVVVVVGGYNDENGINKKCH